jgi:hypothetical protein
MGLINRLRRNLESLGLGGKPDSATGPEAMSFSAEIPLGNGNTPLWRMNVQLISEPQVDGERLRLRAHFQTNFASVLRPALMAPKAPAKPASHSTALTLSERTSTLAQRTLAHPLMQKITAPLLKHDFNTWIEMQTSTASLNDGAHALLPQSDKLTALGIVPARKKDGPVAESWSGQAGNGFAQVSIVQMDKRHLPPRLTSLLQDTPFHMTATFINTVEEK